MKKKTTDRIIGVSAILISLLTLIIFTYQTNIIHKQSRLSVTPRLGIQTSFNQSDSLITYSLNIQNKGIGPAIINSAILEIKGQEYNVDIQKLFDTNFPQMENFGHLDHTSTLSEGSTLASNEKVILFSYTFNSKNMLDLMAYLNIEDKESLPFNLKIKYSSIYDESWVLDNKISDHPKKI